jgi:hypothetical protein
MNRLLTITVCTLIAFFSGYGANATAAIPGGDEDYHAVKYTEAHDSDGKRGNACMEDNPCWNWAKMGNHRRGVVLLDGTPMVVLPCGFNRLWAIGAIRHRLDGYKMNDRLRGDRFARTLTDCPWRDHDGHPYPWHQSPGRWAVQNGY